MESACAVQEQQQQQQQGPCQQQASMQPMRACWAVPIFEPQVNPSTAVVGTVAGDAPPREVSPDAPAASLTPVAVPDGATDVAYKRYEAFYSLLYPFQRELCDACIGGNSIVYLPTGAGKTVIAAAVAAYYHAKQPERRVVFLVHRIPLISQQAGVLRRVEGMRVAEVCGDRKDASTWGDFMRKEWGAVLIIDALFFQWLKEDGDAAILRDVSVLFIDEIHHARKNSNYAKILQLCTNCATVGVAPRIIGLTASPGAAMGQDRLRDTVESLMKLSRCHMVCVQREVDDLVRRVTLPVSYLYQYEISEEERTLDAVVKLCPAVGRGCDSLGARRPNSSVFCLFRHFRMGSPQYVSRLREVVAHGKSNGNVIVEHIADVLVALNVGLLLLEEAGPCALYDRLRRSIGWYGWLNTAPPSQDVEVVYLHTEIGRAVRMMNHVMDTLLQCVGPDLLVPEATRMKMLYGALSDAFEHFAAVSGGSTQDAMADFRGIIFCNTKAATARIVEILEKNPMFASLQPRWFVGHSRSPIDDGDNVRYMGMTDSQAAATPVPIPPRRNKAAGGDVGLPRRGSTSQFAPSSCGTKASSPCSPSFKVAAVRAAKIHFS